MTGAEAGEVGGNPSLQSTEARLGSLQWTLGVLKK